MPSDKSYSARKARMDRDPDFKARVLAAQARSRRTRRQREWDQHVERHGDRACQWTYPNGRRCWRVDGHVHEGDQTS